MQGNIQIEVLNEDNIIVAVRLKGVSSYDKQVLVMSLAQAVGLTPKEIFLTCDLYSDFIACSKIAKTDLSNKRSTPDL